MNTFSKTDDTLPGNWVSPDNMLNTANAYIKVYKNGTLHTSAGMTLAAFIGTTCRGVKLLSGTRTYFALPISSNLSTESGFTFKLFDPANGGAIYDITETLNNFDCVNGYGSTTSPLLLNINLTPVNNPTSSTDFSVNPNPVNDVFRLKLNSDIATNTKIDLFDLQGKFVQTIYSGAAKSNNIVEVNRDKSISKGLYLLKATVGEKLYIAKVILL